MKKGYTLMELLVTIAIIGIIIAFATLFIGGRKQKFTRNFGGTMTYKLDPKTKLVNCTWKENSLWILTTERTIEEVPKSYKFSEKSMVGILQGTVVIREQ
jgi:prepilin-type N-terminal cleavage/methylation domain-containing protein